MNARGRLEWLSEWIKGEPPHFSFSLDHAPGLWAQALLHGYSFTVDNPLRFVAFRGSVSVAAEEVVKAPFTPAPQCQTICGHCGRCG